MPKPDIAAPCGPSTATPSGDFIPLGGLVSTGKPSMPTLREILQPHFGERRAAGRTLINRNVLLHYAGCDCVRACCVRDVTNLGAGIRLHGLNIAPSEFGISFDNFHTMRLCRLIWRDGDFVGVTFTT
jgi:hypothetical protein